MNFINKFKIKELKKFIRGKKGIIYDIGCSIEIDNILMKENSNIKIIGTTISSSPRYKNIMHDDIVHSKLSNNIANGIICSLVIDHVVDYMEALRQIRRIMKNNSKGMIIVFNKSLLHVPYMFLQSLGIKIEAEKNYPVCWWFSKLEFKKVLKESGFVILNIHSIYYDNLLVALVKK